MVRAEAGLLSFYPIMYQRYNDVINALAFIALVRAAEFSSVRGHHIALSTALTTTCGLNVGRVAYHVARCVILDVCC